MTKKLGVLSNSVSLWDTLPCEIIQVPVQAIIFKINLPVEKRVDNF